MRLFFASVLTLSLMGGFLMALALLLLYFSGSINIIAVFTLTIIFNIIIWLVGPFVMDYIYKFFYKIEWITVSDLKKISPASASLLEKTCEKYGFKVPKLGLIRDKNPNAFTYGSGRWNSRLVVTQGIFEYLDENERTSVFAHELGHVKNRDFIVMTIASTMLQLLYEVYATSMRAMKNAKKGNIRYVIVIGIIAYIFYWIAGYLVLYLSRVREYYADEFSAAETNPNYLSSALLKISYGIFVNPDDKRLVQSVKHMGITDFRLAESAGMAYYANKNKSMENLGATFLFDFKNPWAFLIELGSTHPLTGKRIKRLCSLAQKPMFDFDAIEKKFNVDMGRMMSNFAKDVIALSLPAVFMILFPVIYLLYMLSGALAPAISSFAGGWLVAIGIGMVMLTLYKYPGAAPQKSSVVGLMADPYASPVRGKPVALKGKIIGKGIPGYRFSEDMMMQDDSGLMLLNYESWAPWFGNFLFGWRKVPKLLGKNASASGWFVRGISSSVGLSGMQAGGEKIRSYVKLSGLLGAFILIALGVGILLFVPL